MDIYNLSRNFWDWAFENPEKVTPNHCAIYFFAIEHCNRLGWREKFGFPTMMACDAIGIRKPSTYIKYFNDLVDWGFIKLIEKSRNQYSANIISLPFALPKNGKAILNHRDKQTLTTGKSKVPVDIQPTTNNLQLTITPEGVLILWDEIKKSYNPKSRNTVLTTSREKSINARIKEGNAELQFIGTFEYMFSKWYNDTNMKQYLTPETILGTKFTKYLEEARDNSGKKKEVFSNNAHLFMS